ncbi:MAG: hypothetical protein ABIX01_03885 [Chitinophagaceae bacterium]
MKQFTVIGIFLLSGLMSFAQNNGGTYNWAAGLKYQPAAVSLKHYNKKGDAIEFLLTKYNEGTRLTTLLELSPKITKSGSLRFIVGPGFHLGIWDKDIQKNSYIKNPIIGFDGILGIEFKIPSAPIAIQLDYQPSVDVVGNSDIFKDWGGITIKFCW